MRVLRVGQTRNPRPVEHPAIEIVRGGGHYALRAELRPRVALASLGDGEQACPVLVSQRMPSGHNPVVRACLEAREAAAEIDPVGAQLRQTSIAGRGEVEGVPDDAVAREKRIQLFHVHVIQVRQGTPWLLVRVAPADGYHRRRADSLPTASTGGVGRGRH